MEKYCAEINASQCCATKYVKEKGASVTSENDKCWWWLRSSGKTLGAAAGVNYYGDVVECGNNVTSSDNAVRPAMWIKLD